MLISKMFQMEDMEIWDDDEECEDFSDHIELKERLRRTLYFGKTPKMDRSSLPMTELTVEYFQEAVPRELGRVDMYWASSVSRKASISPCAMMLGMLYIDRLRYKNPDYLEKMSSEELFLISMMLASKYLYDEGVTEEVYNDEWAESANLDLEDINQLERDFLLAIDWNLFVSDDEFLHVLDAMEEEVALRQGNQRGYLTYSDLCALLRHGQLKTLKWDLLRDVCKVFAVCSLAYTAGTLTIAGSTTTLALLKAELHAPHPSSFDLLPLSLLMQHFSSSPGPLGSPRVPSLQNDNTLVHAEQKSASSYCNRIAKMQSDAQESCQRECLAVSKRHKVTPTISQFLTLTLFKDTLMAFIVGKKDDAHNDTDTDTPTPASSHRVVSPRCHCPVCPLNTRRVPRRNKTYHHDVLHGVDRPAHTNWNLLNERLQRDNGHPNLLITNSGHFGGGNVHGTDCTHPEPDTSSRQWLPWQGGYERRSAQSCSQVWQEGVNLMGNQYIPTRVQAAPLMV